MTEYAVMSSWSSMFPLSPVLLPSPFSNSATGSKGGDGWKELVIGSAICGPLQSSPATSGGDPEDIGKGIRGLLNTLGSLSATGCDGDVSGAGSGLSSLWCSLLAVAGDGDRQKEFVGRDIDNNVFWL